MFKLYDYFRSSACYRVRIALNLKDADYDIIPIHLLNNGGEQFSIDYQHINPQCLVPTLQHDDQYLTQSFAIIQYLDEVLPSPPLFPRNLYTKALAQSFALSIAADIHPLNNLRVLNYLTNQFNISAEQKNLWYRHWVETGLLALEKILTQKQHNTAFCFGDTPSVADIFLIPQLFNARRFECDLSACPTLMKIEKHCESLVAFNDAKPTVTATTN